MTRHLRRYGILTPFATLFRYNGFWTTSFFIHVFLSFIVREKTFAQLEEVAEFVDMQLNFTYIQGDLAILYCRVTNLGSKSVIWRRTSQPNPISIGTDIFAPDDRYHVQHIPYRGNWNLLIKNVSSRDAGVYECQISAKERAGSRRLVLLNVIDPPSTTSTVTKKSEIKISGSTFVEVGNTISVSCNASTLDFPTDEIDWFIDGRRIKETTKIKITKHISLVKQLIHSVLTVNDAKLSDAGTYVCRTSDLQITSTKVHVLSARSQNSKRGTNTRGSTSTGGLVTGNSGQGHFNQITIYTVACLLFIQFVFFSHRQT